MLAYIHYSNDSNVGDKYSAPYHYFDFGKYNVINMRHMGSVIDYDAAIFGGGAIAGNIITQGATKRVKARKLIGWGIGRTIRGVKNAECKLPLDYPTDFDLIGARDYCDITPKGLGFVPCVSCMHPRFDYSYRVQKKFVAFLNAKRTIPRFAAHDMKPCDVMLNNTSLERAINHIGSAEVVITNSYHGAYWAMLLGRGVIVHRPYSSKFYHFKWPVAHTYMDSFAHIKNISTYRHKGVLQECRKLNEEFAAKVRRLLNV